MAILGVIILVLLDQGTKYWARTILQPQQSIALIPNFFHLTYVENRGAAFGILQGQAIFFSIVTIVAMILLIGYYKKQKKRGAQQLRLLKAIISVILSGAIGNLVDRIFFGFVTDMIDVRGIWSFVFNVADIYVVCGILILSLYIFKYDLEK